MISKDSVERMTLSQKFKWYATVYTVESGSQLSIFRSGWEVIFLHRNRIEHFLMMKLIVFLTACTEEKISLWYLFSNILFFHVAYSHNYWYKLLPPNIIAGLLLIYIRLRNYAVVHRHQILPDTKKMRVARLSWC